MAEFNPAFERMIVNEGGYKLHKVAGDTGGQTYAGIARNMNPHWPGWVAIDAGDVPATALVRSFYKAEFWDRVAGDRINEQRVAENIFDFGVNAGWKTSAKLAQVVVGATPDGVVGPATLERLNLYDANLFMAQFALAKLTRYRDIVARDRTQQKFLLGWINRTLKEAA